MKIKTITTASPSEALDFFVQTGSHFPWRITPRLGQWAGTDYIAEGLVLFRLINQFSIVKIGKFRVLIANTFGDSWDYDVMSRHEFENLDPFLNKAELMRAVNNLFLTSDEDPSLFDMEEVNQAIESAEND